MAEVARKSLEADIGIGITGMGNNPGPDNVVYVSINDGSNHELVIRPRGKQRLSTAVLFELRSLLLKN
jgi:nicotinamide mononucleotide (NMN) deamidase PncC